MKIKTACPSCAGSLELDASYVGTRRICPACGERFLFEVDEAELAARHAAEHSAARQPAVPRLQHLGCTVCRVSYNRKLKGNETEVRCTICGQAAPLEQAVEDGRRFDELERQMWDLVQRCEPGKAIDLLSRQGLPMQKARERVDTAVTMLPFVRSEWRFSPPVKHPELCPPPWCEACERSVEPLMLARVMWRRDDAGLQSVAGMTAVAGGLLLGAAATDVASAFMADRERQTDATGADHMEGHYYLCGPCLQAGPKAFGNHRRFPAGQGLAVREVNAEAPRH